MANFSQLITTTRGQGFMSRVLDGEFAGQTQTPFTRIVTSSAVYQMSELESLTELTNIRQETLVSSVTRQDESTVIIHGGVDNSGLNVGYRLAAVGVYFLDTNDGQEYLFGVAIHIPTTEEPNPDFIFPFNGLTITGMMFDLIAKVGNADNISLEANSAVFVTVGDLEAHNRRFDAHRNMLVDGGWFVLLEPLDPVTLHNINPTTHVNIVADGGAMAVVGNNITTLEEHKVDANAHQNIILDGNNSL